MTIPRLIAIIFTLSLLSSCEEELKKDDGKTYHHEYVIGKFQGLKDFYKLTENELSLDSAFGPEGMFKENRGRASFGDFFEADSGKYTAVACNCGVKNDSLFIASAVGFMGAVGYNIIVKDKQFESSFIATIDGDYYKTNLSDSGFSRAAKPKIKYQYLAFTEKPTFKEGQQLTGFMTLTTDYFYESAVSNSIDSHFVKGGLYFTCKTRKLSPKK